MKKWAKAIWQSLFALPAGENPLPKAKLIALSSTLFCNGVAISVVFPFVGFMMRFFGISEVAIGRNSGFVASAYMVGQFLSAYAWGAASDRLGRRPVLLTSLCLTAVSIIGFGFSTGMESALMWRFAAGLCNGITGVAKAVLTEISDDTNSGRAFGWMGVMWGLGMIFGPSIGGYLAMPATQYPGSWLDTPLWRKWPFLLPCLVAGFLAAIGFVMGFFYVQETLPSALRQGFQRVEEEEEEEVEMEDVVQEEDEEEIEGKHQDGKGTTIWVRCCTKIGMLHLMHKKILVTTSLYALIGASYMIFDESFNVWGMLQREEEGLELTSSNLGTIVSSGGIVTILGQLLVYPRLQRAFGALRLFRAGCFVVIPFLMLLPWVSKIENTAWVWVCLLTMQLIRVVGGLLHFISVFVLIGNSAPLSIVGSVNGLAATLCTIGRAIGPMVGGMLLSYAVSDPSRPWPLHGGHLVFTFVVVLFLFTLGLSMVLDKSIDRRLA